MKLSFCIITIGSQPEKLNLCLKSIENNFINSDIKYEIILVGNNIPQLNYKNLKIIEDTKFVQFLGKRKNIATENSSGDILIHCDDDILFCPNWLKNFLKYSKENKDWQILGNKILLPYGGRHWDRATYKPVHVMVDYDYESDSDTFYQTGGFSVCKRELFEKEKWDSKIPFNGHIKGFKYSEDVDFSIRLKENNIKIFFDKNNTVWHYDYTYKSNGHSTNKNPLYSILQPKCDEFVKILNKLNEK